MEQTTNSIVYIS